MVSPLQILFSLLTILSTGSVRAIYEMYGYGYLPTIAFIIAPLAISVACVVQSVLLAKRAQVGRYFATYFVLELFKMALSFTSPLNMIVYIILLPTFVVYWQNIFLFEFSVFQRNKYAQKTMYKPVLWIRATLGLTLLMLHQLVWMTVITFFFMELFRFTVPVNASTSEISDMLADMQIFSQDYALHILLFISVIFLPPFCLLLVYFKRGKGNIDPGSLY